MKKSLSQYQPVADIYVSIFGVRISPATIARNLAAGLRCFLIGGRWLSTHDDVTAFETAKSAGAKKRRSAPEIAKSRSEKSRERAHQLDEKYLDGTGAKA